jgi:predicted DNA-binding ribbon-helix-helix protein
MARSAPKGARQGPADKAFTERAEGRGSLMSNKTAQRTVTISGRKLRISLEDPFWDALAEIAGKRGISRPEIVREVLATGPHANFSSAIRVYILDYHRTMASEAGNRTPKSSR